MTIDGRLIEDYSVRELAAWRAVMPQDSVLRFAYRVEEVVRMGAPCVICHPTTMRGQSPQPCTMSRLPPWLVAMP
ncbi:hypothetical protein A8U91_02979 [Halomonas elongata]|uniref:Uncharacterized protein n=1 Tax=Halomonas elongata TaxID=2746 RepID=A0A1B8NVD2_HALEL|nr:hypothetical protein A8U91_02979 [Halomonas elongata]